MSDRTECVTARQRRSVGIGSRVGVAPPVCACARACVCASERVRARVCVWARASACQFTCACVRARVRARACLHASVRVRVRVRVRAYVRACVRRACGFQRCGTPALELVQYPEHAVPYGATRARPLVLWYRGGYQRSTTVSTQYDLVQRSATCCNAGMQHVATQQGSAAPDQNMLQHMLQQTTTWSNAARRGALHFEAQSDVRVRPSIRDRDRLPLGRKHKAE
jgi:hypothetical protein